jgi:Family of unknown function (DUF6082)
MSSGSTLPIISTLLSSIALIGVALSLLLQARQLRTNRLQASRAAQIDLIKLSMDNPEVTSAALGWADLDAYVKSNLMTWNLKNMEMSYANRVLSAAGVHIEASLLFNAEFPREW